MTVRAYIVLVELHDGKPGTPPFELRLIDAYEVVEASRQVLIETIGLHECANARITFIRPATPTNMANGLDFAQQRLQLRQDGELQRMPTASGAQH